MLPSHSCPRLGDPLSRHPPPCSGCQNITSPRETCALIEVRKQVRPSVAKTGKLDFIYRPLCVGDEEPEALALGRIRLPIDSLLVLEGENGRVSLLDSPHLPLPAQGAGQLWARIPISPRRACEAGLAYPVNSNTALVSTSNFNGGFELNLL
jgi:hypothetical protein